MPGILQKHSKIKMDVPLASFAKGIGWGIFGGLVATLVMDLILMGILVAVGLPAAACFSIVGDTVASLFSPSVIGTAGSIPLGIFAHYMIGPLMGAVFGAAVMHAPWVKVRAFRVDSPKKVVFLAALYTEILSQPMLVMAALLLHMTPSEMLQWFAGSMVMHMIWGCILGVVVYRALRLRSPMEQEPVRW